MSIAGRALALVAGSAVAVAAGAAAAAPEPVFQLAAEVERNASRGEPWPGFRPLSIPLAIYDGKHTYLFRHPAPPEGFAPLPGASPAAAVLEGRHPAVTANSSAEIGGTMTATLLFDPAAGKAPWTGAAETAIHESFHVFQRERHPAWSANEADLLVYPFEDPELLTLRRMETEALRRALAPPKRTDPACWARHALLLRERRFDRLDSAFVAYEREAERAEGLADYVALRASGREPDGLPEKGFAATKLRDRVYDAGVAWAKLLDRFEPAWVAAFERAGDRYLDEELSAVLGSSDRAAGGCYFSEQEAAAIERAAKADAKAVATQRVERRTAFDERPGFRVVITAAPGKPLWPERFDPLNLERVEGGLLHARMLRLGNETARVEMVDDAGADLEALTEGAGEHPLFHGVRRFEVVLPAEPAMTRDGESTMFRAPGFEACAQGAQTRQEGSTLFISWGKGP